MAVFCTTVVTIIVLASTIQGSNETTFLFKSLSGEEGTGTKFPSESC